MPEQTIWGELLTLAEAAEYCKYSDYTFRTEYKDMGVPVTRVAGRPLFLPAELDAWMAKNPRNPNRIHPRFREKAA